MFVRSFVRFLGFVCTLSVTAANLPGLNECGKSASEKEYVKGNSISADEFPWTAILEAAVRLGESTLNSEPNCDNPKSCLRIEIDEEYVHPNFMLRPPVNNIALLKLATDVEFTDFARPVCLPWIIKDYKPLEKRNETIVVGWGTTGDESIKASTKVKISQPYEEKSVCREKFDRVNHRVNDDDICAGSGTIPDACNGFSGAGLVRNLENNRWLLEGIESFGASACGSFPNVFANVAIYEDWIKQIVNE